MSVEEIKRRISSMTAAERAELSAYLAQFRARSERQSTPEAQPEREAINLGLNAEIARLVQEIDRGTDEDRAAGRLEPELIDAAIREHRRRHPYGR